MSKSSITYCIIFVATLILLANCTQKKKSELLWEKNLFIIGSQSSPRAVDLNEDGTLDIVMGAGKNEFQHAEQGIIALDGHTGTLLWQHESEDQVYGSATFFDITGDGIKDVFIGGRSPNLKALNGKTGELLWTYDFKKHEHDPILKHARFNFHNSVLVPDRNNSGFPELLIVNGGNAEAAPHSEENRFPGVLMLIETSTGEIMAADTMPDGKESYMSPLCFSQNEGQDLSLVFGTGGETVGGSLYMAGLSDLMAGNLSNAKVIASDKGHGFIAAPVVADITQDGYYDIVAISHGSTAFAIDGKDKKVLWQKTIEDTESSNGFAVGYFTEDEIPDFFTFVSKGEWPDNSGSIQVMFDGKDGQLVYMDSIGCTGFSSPVVFDLNADGREEVIISINEFDCNRGYAASTSFTIENKLLAIDFSENTARIIDQTEGFKNIFSTPWIGDLDQDGYLDIIHCQYYSPSPDLLSFLGMRLRRIATPVRVEKAPLWGAYMGSEGNGIFPRISDADH